MTEPTPRLSETRTNHGLTRLTVHNRAASAVLYTQGAHLTAFIPRGRADLLWVSGAEDFRPGQAIRGGIPICWPWFGAHPTEADAPAHGLVRTREWDWRLLEDAPDRTRLSLTTETDGADSGFPYRARAELTVTVADALHLSLTTTNLGDAPFELSQALHTYLPVSDLSTARVEGLAGRYRDKVTGDHGNWPVDFRVDREIDRILLDDGGPVRLVNADGAPIRLERRGSRSLVVWNPWRDKSRRLSHFNDDDYRRMLCLEAANVDDDRRILAPGEDHRLDMTLRHDA